MLADLKPYSEMRDSGVEWLGEVPAHWDVRRLAQFGTISKGSGGNKDDERSAGVPCIRYGDLYTTHHNFIQKSRSFVSSERVAEYTPTRFGDVLFASSGETIDEIGKSAANVIQADACCGGDVIIFRPTESVDARYLGYVLDCRPVAAQKARMGRGITVMHIYGAQLKYLMIPLPPLMEQTAIARFLDHADRRIQRYIHTKQKLIALLEEQQQTLINHVVTGEINVQSGLPYATYRESSIAWLREVPQHWRERSLSTVASSIQTGPFGSQLHADEYVHDGVPVINPSHMRGGTLVPDPEVSISMKKAGELSRHSLLPDDIVMARRGEVGRCALVTEKEAGWICGTGSLRVRPIVGMFEPRYLLLVLSSGGVRDALTLTSIGATMDNLNAAMVSRLQLPLPPVTEQVAIVDSVERSKTQIDKAMDGSHREIEVLREYWSALVAQAVTGAIDVRQVAHALTDLNPANSNVDLSRSVDMYADSEDELDASAKVLEK